MVMKIILKWTEIPRTIMVMIIIVNIKIGFWWVIMMFIAWTSCQKCNKYNSHCDFHSFVHYWFVADFNMNITNDKNVDADVDKYHNHGYRAAIVIVTPSNPPRCGPALIIGRPMDIDLEWSLVLLYQTLIIINLTWIWLIIIVNNEYFFFENKHWSSIKLSSPPLIVEPWCVENIYVSLSKMSSFGTC